MRQARKCLLSVAMIVKDEEHNIRRALESLKGVADEIVVVDTGSTDRTPEIVREYTDKLYFHPWKNDFSEARNNSLKYPTCEWVLILDADEELSEEARKNLRDFLESLPSDVNTVYMPTLSYLDWDFKKQEIGSMPRIFRNGTVYYQNSVHNQPVYKPKITNFPHNIIHYGYIWTRKLRKKKYQRTRNMIVDFLKECKDVANRLYYLVQLYKTETTGGKNHARYKVGWQILEELRKAEIMPSIVFEFLYLFGIEAVIHGYNDLGESLLKEVIKRAPHYPDPYFGMMASGERKKDWDMIIEYGNKFLEKLDEVMKKVEDFTWTIMTLKEKGTVYALLARAYFEKKDAEKFGYYAEKALENFGENVRILMHQVFERLDEVDVEFFKEILPHLVKIQRFASENGIKLKLRSFLIKLLENGIQLDESTLGILSPSSRMERIMLKRLKEKEDMLLEFFLENRSPLEFVKENGAPALVLLFDILKEKASYLEVAQFLNDVRKLDDKKVSGIAHALLGDMYLKDGKIREAIGVYRRAVGILPELASFVKPIIEDLKTFLDHKIDGVYEELIGYFGKRKDLMFEFAMKYKKEDLSLLYLVSDHPFAVYISAIACDDAKKKRELLTRLKDKKELFPFYYYHLAKTYEEEEPRKAFDLHIKACEENEHVGDLKLDKFPYTGFYPIDLSKTKSIKNSETMWVGNVSEKIPTLGVINPVRRWEKVEKGKMLAYPYPSDEAVKLYFERAKNHFKKSLFRIDALHVAHMLKHVDWYDVRVYHCPYDKEGEVQWIESVFQDFGVNIDDTSRNFIVVSGVEQVIYLKSILEEPNEVILFFWVPVLDDREDLVWYFPPFRVLRTLEGIKEELKPLGYTFEKIEVFGRNLRGVLVRKNSRGGG